MNLIAIHTVGHDTSLSYFVDCSLVFAIEGERISRKKHEPNVDYCLNYFFSNYDVLNEVDLMVFSTNIKNKVACIDQYDALISRIEKGSLFETSICNFQGRKIPCVMVAHEVSHAMTALHYAGYQDNSIILVNEGRGTFSRNSTFRFFNGSLSLLDRDSLPWHSTGFGWTSLANLLGYDKSPSVAGTVMAMGGYGEYNSASREIINSIPHDIHLRSFEEQQNLRDKSLLQMKQNLTFEGRASFVHTFQQLFNETIYAYISNVSEKYQPSKVCLSGGCALNINCNTFLRNNGIDLVVPPICNDSGQSIGAALFVLRVLFHQTPAPFSIYSNGVGLDDLSIHADLRRAGFPIKEYDPHHIAGLIRRGKVICYMRGKSELGPRALGQRSILACSETPGNRTKISESIKNREWFRPLAGVMRKEKFHELFGSTLYSEHMLYNYEISSSFSEIRHIDGTCRIQTLEKDFNPALYELLLEYEKLGGAILINTSLNGRNKAICQTPSDVLSDFSEKAGLVDSYVFNNLMSDNL